LNEGIAQEVKILDLGIVNIRCNQL